METETEDMFSIGGTVEKETHAVKPEKKKVARGNTILKGVSLKKRLVQTLVSPRKELGQRMKSILVKDSTRGSQGRLQVTWENRSHINRVLINAGTQL